MIKKEVNVRVFTFHDFFFPWENFVDEMNFLEAKPVILVVCPGLTVDVLTGVISVMVICFWFKDRILKCSPLLS